MLPGHRGDSYSTSSSLRIAARSARLGARAPSTARLIAVSSPDIAVLPTFHSAPVHSSAASRVSPEAVIIIVRYAWLTRLISGSATVSNSLWNGSFS